jgi:polyisoprenoid-binding protein YceI
MTRVLDAEIMRTNTPAQVTYNIQPGRSAVLVRARSNVGPISFATSELEGVITTDGVGRPAAAINGVAEGRLTIQLASLTSGNDLYDAEIRRRIDTRRFPVASLRLRSMTALADRSHYDLVAELQFHDTVREIRGSATVDVSDDSVLIVRGQQSIDVRDFNLEIPSTLVLKIYPDVSIEMYLEARAE